MNSHTEHTSPEAHRKLRAMVITMGGDRQTHMESLFAHPRMARDFEAPVFVPGIPSRSLRQRGEFFRIANQAGLLPQAEWEALDTATQSGEYDTFSHKFFDCLQNIPVTTGRLGSDHDKALHYSVELWRKSKTINRGRSVLGCTLAHLIALKRFVEEDFDVLLEDNVRASPDECARRIRKAADISRSNREINGVECHFRYLGWLGSITNLTWIFDAHVAQTAYKAMDINEQDSDESLFTSPVLQDIKQDYNNSTDDEGTLSAKRPGGSLVWGAYAYWMSKEAYEGLLQRLRKDVGALMWKGKRMRSYRVKPIDKILPRTTAILFGQSSVQITTHPAFFRAPMLTSKIHTQWDPEFCKSTHYQLQKVSLHWSDLWLTVSERKIVEHFVVSGEWLTLEALEDMQRD